MKFFLNWEVIEMTESIIGFCIGATFVLCAIIAGRREFSDKCGTPWEKAEKKAARRKAREEARARRRARGRV